MATPSCCIVLLAVAVMFAAPLRAQQGMIEQYSLRVEKQGSFFVGGHDIIQNAVEHCHPCARRHHHR